MDNPRDLKFEMTARAVGWELLGNAVAGNSSGVLKNGVPDAEKVISHERRDSTPKAGYLHEGLGGRLRRTTQDNLRKVLRFRPRGSVESMALKANEHMVRAYFVRLLYLLNVFCRIRNISWLLR